MFYIQWLYDQQPTDCVDAVDNPDYRQAARLYVFGENIQDTLFQNQVLEDMIRSIDDQQRKKLPDYRAINIIYEGTPTESPARDLLVEAYVQMGTRVPNFRTKDNLELKNDLLEALLKRRQTEKSLDLWPNRDRWLKESS